MAQTGYTPILIYSSSTASAAPAAGNLTNSTLGSELAINITDGKLFYKDNANAVQVIGWKTTPTTAGGTGLTSYTAGDLLYYASGTALSKLGIGSNGQILKSTGTAPAWESIGNLAVTSISFGTTGLTPSTATQGAVTVAGTLVAANGGTGQSSYTIGDILYASGTTTLAKLADVATGNALISGGVGVAPSWGKIGLTTHVSGVLPVANGGTNASSASITAFNNITGYTASGATGTTSTNLVFSTSPTLTTPKATSTIGVGNATAASTGCGITFPATPSLSTDANTLDIYEEGTYTVVFKDNTLSNYSLTSSNGRYTRIGNRVFVWGNVVFAGGPPGGGFVIPANLPFAINSTTAIVGSWSYGPAGDTLCRNGPSGNWAWQGSFAYGIQYGNNSATLFNGVAATDYMAFVIEYQV